MRLAIAFVFLPLATSQFFAGSQNPQSQQQQQNQHIPWVGPQRDSPGLHPNQYQGGLLNQPYAQRTGQQNAGGIMRQNPAIVPNSQTNQHPIFDLMRNQNSPQHAALRQTNPNLYQNQAQQPQAQPNPFQQNSQSQQNPQIGSNQQHPFQQNQNPQIGSNQQNPFQQNSQNQQNPFQQNQQNSQNQVPRPRAFNRLSNRVDQWQGSSGINSPGIFTTPNRGASSALNPGANFYIQLSNYVNERLAMKGGTTCYCPREECTIIENILHPCYFSFTIVIGTSSGEPVHYIAKQFVAVNSTGQPSTGDGDWTVPTTIQLVSKPTYVDIFVNNLGPVINGRTVNYLDEFWQVDTFTLDLTDYQPSIANQQPTPVSSRINGQLVGSNLELTYYVQCQTGFVGDNCDLTCRPTKNQGRTICTNRITNSSSVCASNSTQGSGQVSNCQACGYGVVNDECADLANFNGRELGVNSAFRVWTIVLAVLLAIAIIFIIILVILYVLAERKLKREHEQELQDRNRRPNGNGNGHNGNGIGAYENGRHAISSPLIGNEWDKPSHPPHAFAHHGVESESNHSGSAPPRSGLATASAFQAPRREAQV